MSITTKRGDEGQTDLLGARVGKGHALVELIGTIDELNANLGVVLSLVRDRKVRSLLRHVQEQLFVLGAEVASVQMPKREKIPHLTERDLRFVERASLELEGSLPPLRSFILPGGSLGAAKLHLARTVARRAERRLVLAAVEHPDLRRVLPYLNRLSDLLFALARAVNRIDGVEEVTWKGS